MVLTAEKYIQLSNLAVAAAMDPDEWQVFIEAVAGAMPSHVCTQLIGYDKATNAAPLAYSSGYDPEILKLYETYFADRNPFAVNFPKCGIGDVISSAELCAPDTLKRTQFYADILLPLEDLYAGGGSMLAFDSDRMFLLGGNMRAKDKEKHEGDWLRLCASLAPIIRQSLEINRMITGLKFEKWAAERHLLGAGTAIVVVDSAMMIHYACQGAENLIACGKLIGSDLVRRLKFRSRKVQAQFLSHVRVQASDNPNMFKNVRLYDRDGQEWICRTMGMRLGDLDKSPFGTFVTGSGLATVLAFKPVCNRPTTLKRLQKSLSLSKAEAESALLLSEGLTPGEIAAERDVSIHTVRNQIKAALSKTGCHRQRELVHRIEQLGLLSGR
ncbi:helix-turn-helix transcriptional regulator [Roseibium album]|uniref:helix-turn-helix transcriptional regulator n=1 Tax=Roseibium album TaxID=311410 RepID=UPI00248FE0C4|nr:helix-turn-helix transcriptional regulator [Roseibium album]